MKKLAPGIYVVNDKIQVDIPEILVHMGYEDTEQNRDLCVEVAEKTFRKLGIITPKTTVLHRHHHRCPRCGKRWEHDGKLKKCGLGKCAMCGRCNS